MSPTIRPHRHTDVGALVQLTLSAFAPIFDSFRRVLGADIYPMIRPDWGKTRQEAVEKLCGGQDKAVVWVAGLNGTPVGFVAHEARDKDQSGEIQLLAVHPEHQNRGIGTQWNERALREMKDAGDQLAEVCAGGDASHAPARRSCEKAGHAALPLVRHCKNL